MNEGPRQHHMLLSMVFVLGACASAPRHSQIQQAINAATNSPTGVLVELEIPVRNVGNGKGDEKGRWFLDSRHNYNDARSLNLVIFPNVVAQLKSQYGITTVREILNKRVRVRGVAKRVPIPVRNNRTGETRAYFQTQLYVTNIAQIKLLLQPEPTSSP